MTRSIVSAETSSAESEIGWPTGVKGQTGNDKRPDSTVPEQHPQTATAKNGQAVHRHTHLAGAAVAYNGTSSSADVTVEGTVTAPGDVNMKAMSVQAGVTKAISNGLPASKTETSPRLNAAIGVATGETHSNLTVAEGASVMSTNGGVTAAATSANSIDMTTRVMESQTSVGATSVGIVVENSDAKLNLDGTVVGKGGAVKGLATNYTARDNVTAMNSMMPTPESTNPAAPAKTETPKPTALTDAQAENSLISLENLQKFLKGDAFPTLSQKYASFGSKVDKMGELFTAGASIGVNVESFHADVNVGNTANLMGGAVVLAGTSKIGETNMSAVSTMTNLKSETNTGALVGAAVQFSDIDSQAHVKIADSADGKKAKLTGVARVNIQATAEKDWGRISSLLEDWKKMYSSLVDLYGTIKDDPTIKAEDKAAYVSNLNEVGRILNDLNKTKAFTGLDLSYYTTNFVDLPKSVVGAGAQIASLMAGLQHMAAGMTNQKGMFFNEVDALARAFENQFLMWTMPEKYASFTASSIANSKSQEEKNAAIAGTVNITLMNTEADVTVGKEAQIASGAGAAVIKADAKDNSVMLNGKPNIAINPKTFPQTIEAIIYNPQAPNAKKQKTRLENVKEARKNAIIVTPSTSAPNAIGGTVGVAEHTTSADVTIGSGASVTGVT